MRFVRLEQSRVREPFEVADLAELQSRFTAEIVAMCVEVPNGQNPVEGDVWDEQSQTFSTYVPPAPTQDDLNREFEYNARRMEVQALPQVYAFIKTIPNCPPGLITILNNIEAERNKIV